MSHRPDAANEPLVARDATYYKAPEALRERVRARLAAESRPRRMSPGWRWPALGAAFAVAAALAWNAVLLQAGAGREDRLVAQLVAAHVRSLLAESHLADVASSDQHTVKPWFQGKLDFAPNVTDLASSGYALVGGRLDYLHDRPVAALAYKRRLHVINVFEWPARETGDTAPVLHARNGFSVVGWRRGGLEYWAVSDAAPPEVMQLAQLLHGP